MKRNLTVIQTGVDQLVIDEELSKYVRLPTGAKITADELSHYEWKPFEHFSIDGSTGRQRYCVFITLTNRISGNVFGTTQVQI